jgi:prepilin-type processing-associated H-X9-DG protein
MNAQKKFRFLGLLFVISLFVFSCSKDEFAPSKLRDTTTADPATLGITQEYLAQYNEKMALLPEPAENQLTNRSPITYIGELCGTGPFYGTHGYFRSITNSALWDYYSFYGTAGDLVTIDGDRLSCEMDLSFSLYYGTTEDNAGVSPSNGGSDMTFIGFADDQQAPYCTPACFSYGDPYLSVVLPSTGFYTLAVYDYIGGICSEPPYNYRLNITGLAEQPDCDSDGWGDPCDPDDDNDDIADDEDAFTCSNLDETINIDGCDSGVGNYLFADGSTMMDHIMACAAIASNHGDFVSCVSHLTNLWKREGLITGGQKEIIMSCAAGANIP